MKFSENRKELVEEPMMFDESQSTKLLRSKSMGFESIDETSTMGES
jgi:hypothetical protein